MLESFARLLTSDTRACAMLFARDAELTTWVGTEAVICQGRHEIERFLRHVPRQIAFRADDCSRAEDGFRGALVVSASDLTTWRRDVRFDVEDGRFTRLELLGS